MNGKAHSLLGKIPQTTVQDAYAVHLAGQWQMHQQQIEQWRTAGQDLVGLAPELFLQLLESRFHGQLNELVQQGQLVPAPTGELRMKVGAVWRQTRKAIQFSGKLSKLAQQRRQQAKLAANPTEIPVEMEVQSFQRMEFLRQDLLGRKFRTWMLLGSLALFIVSYSRILNADTFLIFMGALLLHEGGHLLAMKLCGYRDTSLLFLPFLGALATAHKDNATLTQKFWISLAGPLPGLILGVLLAIFLQANPGGFPGWLTQASWILIGLNLFNLLPVYPLDGGQIADLLIFSRHPYVGVLFKSIGVLFLALLGRTQPMLWGFALLIALGIPNSFRSAKINARIRKQLRQQAQQSPDHLPDQSQNRHSLLPLIFDQLKQAGQSHLPFGKRYSLAKTLLLSHHELQARWVTRLSLSLVYLLSLVGGMVGSLQALIPEWQTAAVYLTAGAEAGKDHLLSRYQQQIDQATATLQANPDNTEAYQQRAEARLILQDKKGALADYDQLVRLQPTDTELRFRRASYRTLNGNYAGAVQDYDAILVANPDHLNAYQSRAQARSYLRDFRGAAADYSALIERLPDDSDHPIPPSWLYVQRATARQQMKDYKGALADANTAIQLDSTNRDAYDLRSALRHQLGDAKGALADQQQAQRLPQTGDENEL